MNNEFDYNPQPIPGQEPDQERGCVQHNPLDETVHQPSVQQPDACKQQSSVETEPVASDANTPTDGAYHYYYGVRSEQPGSAYARTEQPRQPYAGSSDTHGYGYQPQSPYQVPAVETPVARKKKSGVGTIVLVAVLCLILGTGIGGGVFWMLNNGGNSADGTTAPEEVTDDSMLEQSTLEVGGEAEASAEENTAFSSTTIEITTNSESTAMTPQSVYEHYVNAVVAIANEGTATNIFGQISATASSGSGMIISTDGYILTNNHVVEGAEKLTVTMTNGEEYEATLLGTDPDNDVALIKIQGEGFPTVSIGDSDTIQVGEQLCAIGNPLGELTNTLTVGYVSALDREINEDGIPINMFQTDCAINSGNSGGPIFDMNGNVVGITTAKYSSSGSGYSASIEGIGFCIPINDAMDIVNDLLQYGYVRGRVSMGIMCQAISSTVTQYYNLPIGIYVSSVEPGSAAETAGLREGDIICAIDGVEVTSVTELKVKLKEYTPGDTATLTVYRNETHVTEDVDITFDEMVSTSNVSEETEETAPETQQPGSQQIPEGSQIYPYFPFG